MFSVNSKVQRTLIIACIVLAAAAAGWWAWPHQRGLQRAEYVLINETARHDYDLAFKMSIKLADKSLAELKFLSEHLPADAQTRDWYRQYRKEYDFGG